MKKSTSPYHGFRFPSAVISCAVRWYHRFNLSLRDIEELLPERGVVVTYESMRNRCDRFGATFACRAKAVRPRSGTTWHLDEVFVKLRGEPYVLWRAMDEHGTELDHPVPRKVVTDQLRSYPAAKAEVPQLANVKHVFVKASARVNDRAENSHQPTRRRERQMQGFRDPRRTQRFLSSFGPIRQHFALPRHRMEAATHRAHLKQRLDGWYGWSAADLVKHTR
ncbi:transposase [Paraburkholderia sp. BR10954]|uniref:transposase n=1 Tax=Paraburkholderia sp. BR10954 TaxID=3236995 RepID=UPI0034D15924